MANKVPEIQIEYYKSNPPTCLAEFVVKPTLIENVAFDGHGFTGVYPDGLVENPNIIFGISCNCGSNLHFIVAESTSDEIFFHENLVIAERYFLRCASCSSEHLLFDSVLHGYNPEVDRIEGRTSSIFNLQSNTETSPERIICKCSNCKNDVFDVTARFEYPGDLFHDSTFADRENEFFSWFTGLGKCSKCSTINMPIDYECS